MTARVRIVIYFITVIVLAIVAAYAQQPATVTNVSTVPARFQPCGPTQSLPNFTTTVMRDMAPNSGNTVFLLIESKGLSAVTTVILPATACQ